MEAPSFDSSLFDWFTAHEPAGESTFSSLGISPKRGKAPPAFDVAGPGSTTRTFLHHPPVRRPERLGGAQGQMRRRLLVLRPEWREDHGIRLLLLIGVKFNPKVIG